MSSEHKEFLRKKKLLRANKYLIKVSRWMLINLRSKIEKNGILVKDIINLISTGAFYFVLLIFAFPIALPLPYPPGFPSISGIPIFLLSVQMLFGRKKVILPQFIMNYRIKFELIQTIASKTYKLLNFLSKIIKAGRLEIFASNKLIPIYGILFISLAICILIPFPGTNFIPAVGIFISSLGLLFKDGLLAVIGAIIGILGIIVVYFFSALFAAMMKKFFLFSYTKIVNLYIGENAFTLGAGIIIGFISALTVMFAFKIIKSLHNKKKKFQ